MGSKRLTPTTVGKMALKCLLLLFLLLKFIVVARALFLERRVLVELYLTSVFKPAIMNVNI